MAKKGRSGQEPSTLFAHTHASLTKNLLKIEQHCYLRRGGEVPEQPRITPQITLEPACGTEPEMVNAITLLHERFLAEAPGKFPDLPLLR